MTNQKPAHREFWILQYDRGVKADVRSYEVKGHIHVIEFSRVLELEQELDNKRGAMTLELKRLLDENAQLKAELGKPYDKADRLFENNRKLVAELEAVQEELKLLNEQYAACCAECQGESEENFHLRKERDELLKERAAYRTLNSLMADNAEVCELHDDIEALEAKLAEKDAQREKHNQELSDAYKIFQADLDAAIAAKKKAWEGNKQYEILVDSERAEKNAALAKAQAMEQALTSAQLVMDQALYVGSMAYPSLETFVNNAETCANEIREELAKWRGKK